LVAPEKGEETGWWEDGGERGEGGGRRLKTPVIFCTKVSFIVIEKDVVAILFRIELVFSFKPFSKNNNATSRKIQSCCFFHDYDGWS